MVKARDCGRSQELWPEPRTVAGARNCGWHSCMRSSQRPTHHHAACARVLRPPLPRLPCLLRQDWLGVLPELPACREHLLPGLLRLFAQERYWVQVGNVLLLLVEGTGWYSQQGLGAADCRVGWVGG